MSRTVQRGESLNRIAAGHGTTVSAWRIQPVAATVCA